MSQKALAINLSICKKGIVPPLLSNILFSLWLSCSWACSSMHGHPTFESCQGHVSALVFLYRPLLLHVGDSCPSWCRCHSLGKVPSKSVSSPSSLLMGLYEWTQKGIGEAAQTWILGDLITKNKVWTPFECKNPRSHWRTNYSPEMFSHEHQNLKKANNNNMLTVKT